MVEPSQISSITEKVKRVMSLYLQQYPDIHTDRDHLPLKIGEEWGECLQAYVMLTDRGRQKGKSKEEIRELLAQEIADVCAYLFLFADREGIDIAQAIEDKWMVHLDE